eukprot:COSAG02_NODE_62499_length_265_cov_1.831325_1_plen_66_part_10
MEFAVKLRTPTRLLVQCTVVASTPVEGEEGEEARRGNTAAVAWWCVAALQGYVAGYRSTARRLLPR